LTRQARKNVEFYTETKSSQKKSAETNITLSVRFSLTRPFYRFT